MNWNQGNILFHRFTCPICGSVIPEDDGYGAMELWEYCPSNQHHYSRFVSIYADSVSILDKRFKPNQIAKIEAFLDEVGNEEYRCITETK